MGLHALRHGPNSSAAARLTDEPLSLQAGASDWIALRPDWFPWLTEEQADRPAHAMRGDSEDDDCFPRWDVVERGFLAMDLIYTQDGEVNPLPFIGPSLNNDRDLFRDLLSYAPGMNTTRADIRAVLEAEAVLDGHATAGTIDPAARALLSKARTASWQAVTVPATRLRPSFALSFDGGRRYVYERQLPLGLREHVVCDGETLLHLYPELGLGARRRVSHFHYASLARLLPWTLPAPEDLARSADLQCLDHQTIAILPHGTAADDDPARRSRAPLAILLKFAPEGRLAERCLVNGPLRRIVRRETYSADGHVMRFNAEGKVIASYHLTLRPCTAPNLRPDTNRLVVLALPFRSRDYLEEFLGWRASKPEKLSSEEILSLVGSNLADPFIQQMRALILNGLVARGDHRLGLHTLLIAAGEDSTGHKLRDRFPGEPLAEYLDRVGQVEEPAELKFSAGRLDTFLHSLATFYDLHHRWIRDHIYRGKCPRYEADCQQLLSFVLEVPSPLLSLVIVDMLMRDPAFRATDTSRSWLSAAEKQERLAQFTAFKHRVLKEFLQRFAGFPTLTYAVEYEYAWSLFESGQRKEAQAYFFDLYSRTLKEGFLPPTDISFRQLFVGDNGGESPWTSMLRETAATLASQGRQPDIMRLAWQWHALGFPRIAEELSLKALAGLPPGNTRRETVRRGVEYLQQTGQVARAKMLLGPLLDGKRPDPELLRLGSMLAAQRGQMARSVAWLDRALEIEYEQLPDWIDLAAVRRDYLGLLTGYQQLADALIMLEEKPPPDLPGKVVRAVDRWRALDGNSAQACAMAASVLDTLGAHELAWEYFTSAHGDGSELTTDWLQLAYRFSGEGEFQLADHAYLLALEADPENLSILWDRVLNLLQAGETEPAGELLRQFSERDWPARYRWIGREARRKLQERLP
jgi:tetratricopeptide (TPR) repeat protein